MTDDTHQCPIDRCVIRVIPQQLMCKKHWGMVPRDLQRDVYAAWRRGDGAGSGEHQQAMDAAIHAVELKLAER